MALTPIQQVRLLVQDNTPGLYMIQDDEIEFLLQRNNDNITRTSVEAAKIVILNLAVRGDSTVDIFSLKGSKSAEQYRMALEMFIKDPNLNPLMQNARGYFGGVSLTDMRENDANLDNNLVPTGFPTSIPNNYFSA